MENSPSFQKEIIYSSTYKLGKTRNNKMVTGVHAQFLWLAIKLRLFYFACVVLKKPRVIFKTYKKMLQLRTNVWAGDLKKIYRIDGKYYSNMYAPSWPGTQYDNMAKNELRRYASPVVGDEKMSFVFFAITRKCPLSCEHCFEWDNLNKKESFTREELLKTIDLYHQQGVRQFHLSGGEPMARIKDLLPVLKHASALSECWVVSSGFNLTPANAFLLKQHGCKGIVISIDHYIPELHNLFRGNQKAFSHAVNAVQAGLAAGLVVSISVCATKVFLQEGHLEPYMDFAKTLGVQFVQVLEPRGIGHYKDKPVELEEKHIQRLENAFARYNQQKQYRHYPTMHYHGYHQRRVGCFSGSRSVFVDSAGDVHACPFCHTSSYNILSIIRANETQLPKKVNACPQFEKIA